MSSQAAASSGLLARLAQVVFAGPYDGGRATAALLVRLAAGVVLVVFGVGKFVIYDEEVASFTRYGLPAPEVIVYVIGVVELVGGLLFLAGLVTRPAALMIVGNMLGRDHHVGNPPGGDDLADARASAVPGGVLPGLGRGWPGVGGRANRAADARHRDRQVALRACVGADRATDQERRGGAEPPRARSGAGADARPWPATAGPSDAAGRSAADAAVHRLPAGARPPRRGRGHGDLGAGARAQRGRVPPRGGGRLRGLIEAHPGDVTLGSYTDPRPIEILSVDICKSRETTDIVFREFFPRLEAGSLVLQQDYIHPWNPWLLTAIGYFADHFEVVYEGAPTVVHRVLEPIHHGQLAEFTQTCMHSKDRWLELLDRSLAQLETDRARLLLLPARTLLLAEVEGLDRARAFMADANETLADEPSADVARLWMDQVWEHAERHFSA